MKKELEKIPVKPGVYFFINEKDEVLYVGKARNLKQRVKSYFLLSLLLGAKTQKLVSQIKKVDFLLAESEFEALLLEAALIKKFQPKYNSRLKDDKSFLYIKITDEEFPRVYPARKIEGGWGPFPKAQTVRQILRFIRQIFPYRSCRKLPQKPCLYFDLRLCPAPCFGKIKKPEYRRAILAIKSLLQEKSKKLIIQLNAKMEKHAQKNEFETAAKIRDQITKINYLLESRHPVTSYLENPNLVEDLRIEELSDLRAQLEPYLAFLGPKLGRIEAYDISNLSGKKPTGSMVVFLKGEPEKALYRRFRIKFEEKPNDVGMIKEILRRRFRHEEWELPDLILIDGGKGQVTAVKEVLRERRLRIPFLGLAKRWETLIIPQKQGFVNLDLPPDSPSLNLLKRLRDEAHRFALAYHRKLRLHFEKN